MNTIAKQQCEVLALVIAERDALKAQLKDTRLECRMSRLLGDLYREQRDDARQQLTAAKSDLQGMINRVNSALVKVSK
jgi:hypothetical protein